ncbi:VOC family protein [Olleya sp. YS]|uniref:VOC family protein n=1 Tax=Olleya sp. YS TaxID=3028318 RepID=UPI0024343C43|nr:VOC family protein [Olleya sp. YS]WGD34212.1 VOC family protein [Olleya sp. YS]
MKPINNHINYIEFITHDLEATKTFYNQAFGWEFTDYGDNYVAFESSGVAGGFEKVDKPIVNGVLVVLYHDNLDDAKSKILDLGGRLSVDTFSFPGGRRFQFLDPSGNELAVWCHDQ